VEIEEGKDEVYSHLGHKFHVLQPDLVDLYEKMPRAGSFLLKKDIGLIIANLGLGKGHKVVDAGAGSGSLAMFMGHIVGPEGKVITYEREKRFAKIAEKNIELAGLRRVVDLKVKDVSEGFEEKDCSINAVTLDLLGASHMIGGAQRILDKGGRIGVYTPYIEHARDVHLKLVKQGFLEVKTIESIEREFEFRHQGSRPKTFRVGHSGYLSFGRKV
jgi:tRNA (adenine57-N1/adenine58-N1)-methyltransferase